MTLRREMKHAALPDRPPAARSAVSRRFVSPVTRAVPIAARAVSRRRYRARFPACRTASRPACVACNSATTCAARSSASPSGQRAVRASSRSRRCAGRSATRHLRGSRNSKHRRNRTRAPIDSGRDDVRQLAAVFLSHVAQARSAPFSMTYSHRGSLTKTVALPHSSQEISHDSTRCAGPAPLSARRADRL
nr:hypothetical protein HUO10_001508 [Paraburkholderia busanensis]